MLATVVYVAGMSAYTLTVLGIFGADGAGCLIQSQTYGWKSFHYLTNLQLYMLILAGGYIGTLVFTLLTLLISAKTKSSVPAAIVSFGLIFLPAFLAEIPGSFISKITGLLPDQLLQMNMVVNLFNLYEVGGSIVSAIPILLVVYGVMAVVLLPLIYGVYRKSQVQ